MARRNRTPVPLRVLLIEDSETDAALIVRALRQGGYEASNERVDTAADMAAALDRQSWHLLIADCSIPHFNRAALMALYRERGTDIPLIAITDQMDENQKLEILRTGAADHVTKHDLACLAPIVDRALRTAGTQEKRRREQEALKHSEGPFRAMVENASDIITILDADMVLRYVNKSVEIALGYSRAEMIGKSALAFIHPDDQAHVSALLQGLIQEQAAYPPQEYRVRHKDGSWRFLEGMGSSLLDDPAVEGIIVHSRDITGRRQAEQALRDGEARMRAIVNTAVDGIVTVDERGIIETFNPAAERMFGYSAAEVVGRNITILMPSPYAEEHDEHIARYLRTGKAKIIGIGREAVGTRKDGTVFPLDLAVSEVRLGDRRIFTGLLRDISERKLAEEALRESQRMMATLLSNLPGYAYRCRNDRAWTLDFISEGVLEVTGYAAEDYVVHRTITYAESIHPEDRERVWEEVQAALDRRRPFELIYRIVARSGEVRWVWERGQGVFGPDGVLLHLEGFVTDIHERKQLEVQFLQAQKMEGIGRLAGGVAHDFNNLLTAILGYAELAQLDTPPDSAAQVYLQNVRKAGERATTLTHQLLAFARRQIIEPKIVNLNDLILDVDRMLRRLIGEDIELVTLPESELGLVRVDPGQFEQILVNLAINARDAMPGGGKLTIETDNVTLDHEYTRHHAGVAPGPYVMLAVSDTGVGMTEEVKAHLFEPFFTTKEQGKGTGLGLATCYGIVRQSGGHIWYYSEPGLGTTFKIYLPRVEESTAAVPLREDAGALPRGTETLLVAEDEPLVRDIACRALRVQGYRVLEAANGEEALRIAGEHDGPLHLLVTDVVMPQMGGRELAGRLQRLRPGLRVLYMSGYTDDAIVHHGVLEPGIAFLQKPFTTAALVRRVREELDLRET